MLISDVGIFVISDLGFLLIWVCVEVGIEVDCLLGVMVFVLVLVNSGFLNDWFVFEGFFFVKKGR